MSIKSVTIFGASGNVGRFVVPSLLQAGVKVTVATRKQSTDLVFGAPTVTADYSSVESLTPILKGTDAVISFLGSGGVRSQIQIIDAAIEAGVKYFIPSEFGHNWPDEKVYPLLPIFPGKRETIEHLRSKEKEGLVWTSIFTALFFDWGIVRGVFGVDLKAHKATIWDGGNTKFTASNEQDIADAVVRLITDSEVRAEAANKFVYISSVQTTQNEILAAAEEATGKKFEIAQVNSEQVFEKNLSSAAAGDPGAILQVIVAIELSKRGLSDLQEKAVYWNAKLLTGHKESVRDVVDRLLAA